MYANIIIDISHESVDRTFQYKVPGLLEETLQVGQQVYIPFGSGKKLRKGYVVELTETLQYDPSRLKEISGIVEGSVTVQSQLILLAWWMKERYGSTMNQALKTVLPVKQKVREARSKSVRCLIQGEELNRLIQETQQKNYKARLRLLAALKEKPLLTAKEVSDLKITGAVLKPMEAAGMICQETEESYRNPISRMKELPGSLFAPPCPLNTAQEEIVSSIMADYSRDIRRTYLLHGITGSGKTEIYMELISRVIEGGRQVIVLIPEISLTWQTVMRFYSRFGERVSVLNSRMSAGERYDQYERARVGDIDIIIGPRSALFAPFSRLGLIIIDEEHENAYKSELSPRYDAREVARERARLAEASLVLGSATPSVISYTRALHGEYDLFTLTQRAKKDASLPSVEVVDLRQELKAGNRSIFSRRLKELIEERLLRGEQIMLFINRRGYANFVSCRSCGEALKCPHCDVTLTLHRDGRMMCHYCGYTIPQPKRCPSCGSPYIAPFGTGTQKIEAMARELFPKARILRMDLDTTSGKAGHERILTAFSRGEADILIGTQMIVKGHDFPSVTLVAALAADLSLFASGYRCGEETFSLLTQAAGRAGRGSRAGIMVIQTYQPEHYSIQAAASQDYKRFYEEEIAYRRLLGYPPCRGLLTIQFSCQWEDVLSQAADTVAGKLELENSMAGWGAALIGPVNAPVYKVNDIYRKILYIKHENYDILVQIRKMAEESLGTCKGAEAISIQYDVE